MTLVALLAPVLVVGAATEDGGDSTDVAVSAVGAGLLAVVLALPALLVLRSSRARGLRRAELMRQWAGVDRGPESAPVTGYGTQTPHARFGNAAVVLALAFLLAVLALTDADDADALALVPGPVVAGCFAWATVRKYALRHSWAARENTARARERRRIQYRSRLSGAAEAQRTGLRPSLAYVALLAPVVIVAVVFVAIRPEHVLGIGVVGLLALAVAVFGIPAVALRRRRERARLAEAARALADSFPPGTAVHPVRYGLGAPSGRGDEHGAAAWDCAPPRAGALAIGGGAVHLRGADGSSLDVPFTDLAGAVRTASPVAWLDPALDLLLRSGESIEVRTAGAEEIVRALSGAGVQTVPA
ncbi:hypothetical protein [Streptomyces sp. NPDC002564]|uniref:hypothetical protein n=1 Tax=Streptomyces sp. NPDC002564 TaxID=3364649 RepID=UPI0036AC3045